MLWTHLGLVERPARWRSVSLRMWWTSILSVAPHTSHCSASSLSTTSLRPLQIGSVGAALLLTHRFHRGGIPPKCATKGGFAGPLSALTSRTLYVPCSVWQSA